MNNKKGFTLVELLVVITLIGLLTIIAVPSGIAISKKIKRNMLDTKIEQIESAAIVWGQQNNSKIKGTHSLSETCTKNTGSTITACVKKTIYQLLNEEKTLEADYVEETVTPSIKHLKNPTTDESIKDCYVEIYIKNKRVYAEYTKNSTTTNSDLATCYYSED